MNSTTSRWTSSPLPEAAVIEERPVAGGTIRDEESRVFRLAPAPVDPALRTEVERIAGVLHMKAKRRVRFVVLRAPRKGQHQVGPRDPNYYRQRLEDAKKGDTTSARELLEEFCRASRKRKKPIDEAVLKYLREAFHKILNDYVDATTALLLREPKKRPPLDNTKRDIALALAVQQRLATDSTLTPKAASKQIADFGIRPLSPRWSPATVERAWRTYRDALRVLTPGEITVLTDRDESG